MMNPNPIRHQLYDGSLIAYVGIGIHISLFVALAGICAFDDGELVDWSDCFVPLGLLLIPLGFAFYGASRRSPALLATAAATGLVLGLLSLTGPGLFVMVPAILYGIAAARSSAPR